MVESVSPPSATDSLQPQTSASHRFLQRPPIRFTTEFDSDTSLFFNKLSCKLFDNLAKFKLCFQNNNKGHVSNPQLTFTTKHLTCQYDLEEHNALLNSSLEIAPGLQLTAVHDVKAQVGQMTMVADLAPSYTLQLTSPLPSAGLPKATLRFPYGEVSLEENEDHEEEDAAPKLSVSGIFKGQVLNGICNAQYGDDNLNLRYSYKDEETTFIPSISLPSNALSFSFKRRFTPSDKLSYLYNFDTNYWSAVYKHTVGKEYKVKAGYDSEVRLGWASLWVGDEDGKAKTAPMKMKVQMMLQVPQDDVKSSALMFRVKKRISGFIIHMVVKASSAGVSSPNGVCSSPHKRSPSPSASGSPNKYARHVSPNSKEPVDSPFSSSKTRTIPQYFPRSPHDDCSSSLSKQITCLKDATPNTTTYHLAESSNATHIVSAQKQLTFSPCSSLKDSNPSNPNVLRSTVNKRLAFSPNCTLDGANSNKGKQQFFDTPNVIYHSPSVQNQQTLLQCSSSKGTFGGPTPGNILSTSNHSDHTSSLAISLQSLVLDELEFRKLFMVHSYLGRKKLEDVVSDEDAVEIKNMKNLSMIDFEAKLWAKYGRTYCEPCDRAMHLDWDSGKTYLYHCYVGADGNYQFKGPYLNTRRTHLQRVLGDDNVLIVQFTDDPETSDTPSNYCNWIAAYQRISGGISIGLRHYRLFAFKDGRGDNKNPKAYSKKKQVSSWAVKCYFVRKESIHAPWKDKNDPYILFKKTNHEARCLFMHVHMVSNMAKYISRCSLALSNTIKLRVDLSSVHVERIPDIPCRDEYGHVVCDKDGEPLIHTDGTGFISEDLAMLCAKDFIEAKGKHDGSFEFVDLLKLEEESLGGSKGTETCIRESPLLVQCRLFKEGYAVKGTLLVNKKLKPRTIQVRPSMIKVEKDSRLSDSDSFSSLEIVSISRRPRKANLSKNLIALLSVGGVPKEYFLGLLETTLQEAQKVSSSMRAAVRVGLNYGQMDDSATSVAMIGSGIPLDEPYLQYRLSILANEERKGLCGGKLPVNESFYLIGTADPTGILNSDEVCIILENGQISGKVLVYRNPGLHFGDIHILNARYVAELEEFVGNAKYGIFFSTKGKRSVGSEIANGDFDGDLYWVSKSPQLLHYFQVSKPWERLHSTPSGPSKKPSDLSYEELETELFTQLFASQKQSIVAGKAADAWLTWMDQYLSLGENDVHNKHVINEKLLKLVDLYYDALDAPKSGKTVEIPKYLLPQKYPHFLEKKIDKTYNSSSVLGIIYDTAKGYLPDNASIQDIWKLPCFNVEIPEGCLDLWKKWYSSYRHEMSDAMNSGDESKHNSANIVIKKYKQLLYGTEDFATSSRKIDDIYNEALAIYHVSYDYARTYGDVKKCGFAWKVAGEALCSFHEMKTPGKSIPFKLAVLSMFI